MDPWGLSSAPYRPRAFGWYGSNRKAYSEGLIDSVTAVVSTLTTNDDRLSRAAFDTKPVSQPVKAVVVATATSTVNREDRRFVIIYSFNLSRLSGRLPPALSFDAGQSYNSNRWLCAVN